VLRDPVRPSSPRTRTIVFAWVWDVHRIQSLGLAALICRSRGRTPWKPSRPCCGCRPSPDANPCLDGTVLSLPLSSLVTSIL
jgi:hypothetical protein